MKWITLFLFYLHSLQCQANDHATATINHRQFSSQVHLDAATGLPTLHKSDCECLTKIHLVTTRTAVEPQQVPPLGLCRCQECEAHELDEQGNPKFNCHERHVPEKLVMRRLNRHKRAFSWEDIIGKISLMGSIDNQYSKKTQGYFHYNYGTSDSPGEVGVKPTTAKPTTTTTKLPETTPPE
ncbi:uncharacterized protein LOC120425829 [Culex pipiens pallens]|uniref:uncharacterized protein LOC120425829 n=1 Tax=Culex pipiens pallens TaxID=42434 RepID=UPI001953CAF8|nr:uncharacterized protein LOC120425829 [Culex pipiens pallens]